MNKDFILPDIGEGVVECELMEWLVAEGDVIEEDQAVCEVMTDKAMVQIPSPYSGVVKTLYYQKGQIAKVHQPLFQVEVAGDAMSVTTAAAPSSGASPDAVPATSASPRTQIIDFILPDIGEGIVECELMEWLVAEGDSVEEDQPICEVMTDKAMVQIPAKDSGLIHKLYYSKGQVAKVHQPLFALAVAASTEPETYVEAQVKSAVSPSATQPTTCVKGGKAVASPAVRRLARENELDLSLVVGTGKNGRIYKEDLHRYLESTQSSPSSLTEAPNVPVSATSNATSLQLNAADRVEPIRGIKAAMAKQMSASVQTIPHFTYCDEFDLTELVTLRSSLNKQYADQGIKLSFMPFFIKALSLAMVEFPLLNSRVNEDCSELTYLADHNIGMAVDGKLGLMVPNIKQVQHKSILDVAAEVNRLVKDARAGRVSAADMQGGTISISNIGAIGGTIATPIINKPEVAIVALGKLQTLPRFNDSGEVEARTIMQISWSGDHRVIDGGTIARFCNLWQHYLQQPQTMLMAMR